MKAEKESEVLRWRVMLAALDMVRALDEGEPDTYENAKARLLTSAREYKRFLDKQGSEPK